MRSRPIGIFDSGFGGLSLMKRLTKILPNENIIYFGDSANAPYGDKTKKEIIEKTVSACQFLEKKNIKVLIIACNTACIYAYREVQKKLSIPVIGIITPSYQKVLQQTKNHKIGVIATKATTYSGVYKKKIQSIDHKAEVFSVACPLFVPLIEDGLEDLKLAKKLAKYYLKPLKKKKIDTLLLGCTHYPFMKKIIQDVLGSNIKVIDPSIACAREANLFLERFDLKNPSTKNGSYIFYTSGDPIKFKRIASKFLDKKIDKVLKKR